MKKQITWDDNPRIDIEKRIKQLQKRISCIIPWISRGSIYFGSQGAAEKFYPSMISRSKRDKATRLLAICRAELNLKQKQLKSF